MLFIIIGFTKCYFIDKRFFVTPRTINHRLYRYEDNQIKYVIEALLRNNGKKKHHALPEYYMEEFNEPIEINLLYVSTPSIDYLN
jgi:hypothetical protein